MLVHQVNMETGGNNVENIRKSNEFVHKKKKKKKKKKKNRTSKDNLVNRIIFMN